MATIVNAPEPPTPAYAHFVHWFRLQVQRQSPGVELTMQDFEENCLRNWKIQAHEHRLHYERLEAADRKRFDQEMRAYQYSQSLRLEEKPKEEEVEKPKEAGEKKKTVKKNKDPNEPKRGLTSFLWFCKENREGVRRQHPEWNFVDISREMGRLWNTMPADDKVQYNQMAAYDNQRYLTEMDAYQRKTPGQVKQGDNPQKAKKTKKVPPTPAALGSAGSSGQYQQSGEGGQ